MNTKHITAIFTALMLTVLCASAYVSVPTITDGIGFQYENITIGDNRIQIGGTNITKEATIVVAASDSLHKEGADYICNGINDQDTINAALLIGDTYLMEGHFYDTNGINVPTYRTLEGSGANTIIGSATPNTPIDSYITNLDPVGGNSNIVVRSLAIDGANQTYVTSGKGYGILLDECSDSTISDIWVSNTQRDGVRFEHCEHSIISDIILNGTGNHAIFVGYSSSYINVDNICNYNSTTEHACIEWTKSGFGRNKYINVNNVVGDTTQNAGLYVQHADHVTLSNCITNYSKVSGYQISDAEDVSLVNCHGYGTKLNFPIFNIMSSAKGVTLTNCHGEHPYDDKGDVFSLYGTNVIVSNSIANNCRCPVLFDSNSKNIIVKNCIFSNFTSSFSIRGDNIKLKDNSWADAIGTPTQLVYFYNSANDVQFYGNTVNISVSQPTSLVLQAGATPDIRFNIGYATENEGTATILAGNTTSSAIAHGIVGPSSAAAITVTPTGSLNNASYFYIDTTSWSTFVIHTDTAPGTDVSFIWSARKY